MNLCTRCLAPVGHEQGDELGRCPRCAAEQAVIKAARDINEGSLKPDALILRDGPRSYAVIPTPQFMALRAALAALDGDPA